MEVELTGTLPSFLAHSKRITLIYQSFYFAKTAKNAIFGSLPLRSGYNSVKGHFNAWFYDFPYTYPMHHMTRTQQTKGSTSSESSVFAPSATKMQETSNKMPATLEQSGGN